MSSSFLKSTGWKVLESGITDDRLFAVGKIVAALFEFFHFLTILRVRKPFLIKYDYEITDARTSLFYAES